MTDEEFEQQLREERILNRLRKEDLQHINSKISDHKQGMGREGEWLRIFSLQGQIADLSMSILNASALYRDNRSNVMSGTMIAENIKTLLKNKIKLETEFNYLLRKGIKTKHEEVTSFMIDRARDYPLENLLDIKRGVARCVSGKHEDKNPSMSTKNNFAHCHSCKWTGDPIAVAMKVYGLNFQDAVKRLQ